MPGHSHAGDGLKASGYPSVCSGCGKPVRITGDEALWLETRVVGRTQERQSFHFRCYPRKLAGT